MTCHENEFFLLNETTVEDGIVLRKIPSSGHSPFKSNVSEAILSMIRGFDFAFLTGKGINTKIEYPNHIEGHGKKAFLLSNALVFQFFGVQFRLLMMPSSGRKIIFATILPIENVRGGSIYRAMTRISEKLVAH